MATVLTDYFFVPVWKLASLVMKMSTDGFPEQKKSALAAVISISFSFLVASDVLICVMLISTVDFPDLILIAIPNDVLICMMEVRLDLILLVAVMLLSDVMEMITEMTVKFAVLFDVTKMERMMVMNEMAH